MVKTHRPSRWLRFKTFTKEWIKNNLTITVLVSLLGGVPGLINIYNWATEAPKFAFYPLIATEGRIPKDSIEYWVISGAIYNKGQKPLFPILFDLQIKYNSLDTPLHVYSMALPADSILNTDALHRAKFGERDLLKVTKVDGGDAVYGNLYLQTKVSDLQNWPPKFRYSINENSLYRYIW